MTKIIKNGTAAMLNKKKNLFSMLFMSFAIIFTSFPKFAFWILFELSPVTFLYKTSIISSLIYVFKLNAIFQQCIFTSIPIRLIVTVKAANP